MISFEHIPLLYKMASETYHIGVEMGGTGCKIAFMSSANPEKLIDVHLVPTEKPMKTLENLASFILKQPHTFSSMGIASFGPICIDENDKRYGNITNTPKPNWQNVPVLDTLLKLMKMTRGMETLRTPPNRIGKT